MKSIKNLIIYQINNEEDNVVILAFNMFILVKSLTYL